MMDEDDVDEDEMRWVGKTVILHTSIDPTRRSPRRWGTGMHNIVPVWIQERFGVDPHNFDCIRHLMDNYSPAQMVEDPSIVTLALSMYENP